jgi:predicted nucleic acid-binding protein
MVLVDTSVWLRRFARITPFSEELDRLLRLEQVVGHELVYGELLIGDRGGRKVILDDYEQFRKAPIVAHQELVSFVRGRRLSGCGVGWIDVHLLASALAERVTLWTADDRLKVLAQELGVAYDFQRA